MLPTLRDVRSAARRIAGGIVCTPCPESIPLGEIAGCRIFCKLDNFQRTGSFKERGARNALLQLGTAQRRRGVIAASAGNHALGLAYHGRLLHIPVTVVMPAYAPLIKISTCRRLGAQVVLEGATFAEARAHAETLVGQHGYTYINGYDDPAVIAGQGTLGLEILKQVPDLDAVVVPIGGAGLIAGVALAIKSLRPRVQVIGVESRATSSFSAALRARHPVTTAPRPTLADGLAVSQVGGNAFAIARDRVDRVEVVDETWISLAVLRMLELEKTVVEGAAAAPLAACLSRQLSDLRGRRVVLVCSGGNIDPATLGRVIERGLVADGRFCRFTASISDRPGGLAKLAGLIASTGASIHDIVHDRAFSGADVSAVNAVCSVETRDRAHVRALHRALRRAGFTLVAH
ncbi:MAG: threonine ammonia-lyase [Opitutaceae bacterium]